MGLQLWWGSSALQLGILLSYSIMAPLFIFLVNVSSYQVTPACQGMLHLAFTLPLWLVGVLLGSGIEQE